MKVFDWSDQKNVRLKTERGVSFEQVVQAIEEGRVLDVLEHPNRKRYGGRRLPVVEIDGYAFIVLFVEDKNAVFLKTIIPSRKATRKYLEAKR